jgi:alkaline phosphatase D
VDADPLPLPGDPSRIYRRIGYGSLVDVVAIDTRLEGRSQQLQGLDGGDTIITDPAVRDPARQMYSPAQRTWIEQSLEASRATWKLVLNQVLVSQFKAVGLPRAISDVLATLGQEDVPSEGVALAADVWDGYAAERDRLLGFLRETPVEDVVVLTGDVHTSFANDLSEDPFDPLLPPAAVEFVTPAISNSNFDEGLGVPPRTTSIAVEQNIKLQNPNTRYAELDSNGYVLLDVTAGRLQGEFWFVDTVREPSDGQRLDASFQVLRGAQRLSAGGPRTEPRPQRPAAPPAGSPRPSGGAAPAGGTPPPPPPSSCPRPARHPWPPLPPAPSPLPRCCAAAAPRGA